MTKEIAPNTKPFWLLQILEKSPHPIKRKDIIKVT